MLPTTNLSAGRKMKQFCGLVLLSVALSSACALASGEVANYPLHCQGTVDRSANRCAGTLTYRLTQRTFTVDASQQKVIEESENPGAFPTRLENCTVRNTENWVCHRLLGGVYYRQGMTHGTYNDSGLGLPTDDVVYVSWYAWMSFDDHDRRRGRRGSAFGRALGLVGVEAWEDTRGK
jgi:hypothetical protein